MISAFRTSDFQFSGSAISSHKNIQLIVYVKSSNIAIEGSLGYKELEEDKDRYITLDAYSKYTVNEDGTLCEPPLCCYNGNYDEQCVIKYEDIQRIEKRATEFC